MFTGEKLRVIYQTAVPNLSVAVGTTKELLPSEILYTENVDYLLGGILTLNNRRIDKYQFEDGYCQAVRTSENANMDEFSFYYYDFDHLGNVRQVTEADGSPKGRVVHINNYYPFGTPIYDEANTTNASLQPFKYNGKELDMMHGLNTYDYGARQYYSALPVWDRVDPLAEKDRDISPYHFCHDNPINRIDPDGKDDYYTSNGTYLGTNKAETDYIFIAQDYKQIKEGMYEITMGSRLALPDANLSSEAYSKIFTNSLALNGLDIKELCDNKIQVTIWELEDGGSYIRNDYTDKAKSGDGVASTDMENKSNGALITAYVYPQGSQERDLFATRSNIYSCLGVHEFYGHFKKGYTHKQNTPDATFKKQKDDPSWNKTTSNFKEYIETIIKENGYGY